MNKNTKLPSYKVRIYFLDNSVPNNGFIIGEDDSFIYFDDIFDGNVVIGKHSIKRILRFKDNGEVSL